MSRDGPEPSSRSPFLGMQSGTLGLRGLHDGKSRHGRIKEQRCCKHLSVTSHCPTGNFSPLMGMVPLRQSPSYNVCSSHFPKSLIHSLNLSAPAHHLAVMMHVRETVKYVRRQRQAAGEGPLTTDDSEETFLLWLVAPALARSHFLVGMASPDKSPDH